MGGWLLLVPQSTLAADMRTGMRPSLTLGADPGAGSGWTGWGWHPIVPPIQKTIIQETLGSCRIHHETHASMQGEHRTGRQPWMQMWEIAVAAPEVVAHRTARMAKSGPTRSSADRNELKRMTQEKFEAFGESAVSSAASRLLAKGLAPVRRRATANAKRLRRTPH